MLQFPYLHRGEDRMKALLHPREVSEEQKGYSCPKLLLLIEEGGQAIGNPPDQRQP